MQVLRQLGVPDQLISTSNHDLKKVWRTHLNQTAVVKRKQVDSERELLNLFNLPGKKSKDDLNMKPFKYERKLAAPKQESYVKIVQQPSEETSECFKEISQVSEANQKLK